MDPAILSNNGIGVRLTPSGTTSTAAVAVSPVGTGDSLIVTNPSSCTIYLVIGGSTIQAPVPGTTAGYPILAGTKEDEIVLDKDAAYYQRPYVACNCEDGDEGILIVHRVSR
jgi:hypothetical protein